MAALKVQPASQKDGKTKTQDFFEPSFELLANDLVGTPIPNITNNTCGSGCK